MSTMIRILDTNLSGTPKEVLLGQQSKLSHMTEHTFV